MHEHTYNYTGSLKPSLTGLFDPTVYRILITNAAVIRVRELVYNVVEYWASATQQIWPPAADDTRQIISYNIYG